MQLVRDPLNNEAFIAHGNFGSMQSIKALDAAGNLLRESTHENDPLGRMTRYAVKLPDGKEESYTYSYPDLKTVVMTDSLGRKWTIRKNDFG